MYVIFWTRAYVKLLSGYVSILRKILYNQLFNRISKYLFKSLFRNGEKYVWPALSAADRSHRVGKSSDKTHIIINCYIILLGTRFVGSRMPSVLYDRNVMLRFLFWWMTGIGSICMSCIAFYNQSLLFFFWLFYLPIGLDLFGNRRKAIKHLSSDRLTAQGRSQGDTGGQVLLFLYIFIYNTITLLYCS